MLVLIRNEIDGTTAQVDADLTDDDLQAFSCSCSDDPDAIDPESDRDVVCYTMAHRLADGSAVIRVLPGGAVWLAERRAMRARESAARNARYLLRGLMDE